MSGHWHAEDDKFRSVYETHGHARMDAETADLREAVTRLEYDVSALFAAVRQLAKKVMDDDLPD